MPAWQASRGASVHIFRGKIWLDLADDAFGGPIVQSKEQLSSSVAEFRAAVGHNTGLEWFQCLAEREARTPPVPASLAHTDWKPGNLGGRA